MLLTVQRAASVVVRDAVLADGVGGDERVSVSGLC